MLRLCIGRKMAEHFKIGMRCANDSLALQTREQNNIEHDLFECYISIPLIGNGMQTLIRKISELMQMQKIIM